MGVGSGVVAGTGLEVGVAFAFGVETGHRCRLETGAGILGLAAAIGRFLPRV